MCVCLSALRTVGTHGTLHRHRDRYADRVFMFTQNSLEINYANNFAGNVNATIWFTSQHIRSHASLSVSLWEKCARCWQCECRLKWIELKAVKNSPMRMCPQLPNAQNTRSLFINTIVLWILFDVLICISCFLGKWRALGSEFTRKHTSAAFLELRSKIAITASRIHVHV